LSKVELKPLPPEEALAYFRAKGFELPASFDWQEVWQEQHTAAFTVAKSAGFDILKDIHGAVEEALAEGLPYQAFRERLEPILQQKGWWGKSLETDPKTGETRTVQLGSPRRLQIIYDVNIRMSQAAGRWAQIQRTKKARPYLRYTAVMDNRTRPQHRAWHGTIRPVSDDFWKTHYPPNGWRCRCYVQQLSGDDLEEFGYQVSPAPVIEGVPWRNPRTGETRRVPKGIDPGFGYNPGAAAIERHAARSWAEKMVDMPPTIAAAAKKASAHYAVPALAADFRDWTRGIAATLGKDGKPSLPGTRYPVGVLSPNVVIHMEKQSLPLDSAVVTVEDSELLHMLRDSKRKSGKALPVTELERLVQILEDPKTTFYQDTETPGLLAVFKTESGETAKLVIAPGYQAKVKGKGTRQAIQTNALRTAGLIDTAGGALGRGRYKEIKP
jgi:SPP1 gp7 family putative phage head morphogenesis protein